MIVLTGILQAFVLHVPHGTRYLLDSSCRLTYTCQVHRNKVITCSSQSLLQQNVRWAAQRVVARACLLSSTWWLRGQVPGPQVHLPVHVPVSL